MLEFSLINTEDKKKSFIPDSAYVNCLNNPSLCNDVCSNEQYSPLYNNTVSAPQRELTFCPFGKNNTMNISTFTDQKGIIIDKTTKWGKVPQLDPRPLSRIGLEWRIS